MADKLKFKGLITDDPWTPDGIYLSIEVEGKKSFDTHWLAISDDEAKAMYLALAAKFSPKES